MSVASSSRANASSIISLISRLVVDHPHVHPISVSRLTQLPVVSGIPSPSSSIGGGLIVSPLFHTISGGVSGPKSEPTDFPARKFWNADELLFFSPLYLMSFENMIILIFPISEMIS